MTDSTMNLWIASSGFLIGVAILLYGSVAKKSVFSKVLGVVIILGGFMWGTVRGDDQFRAEQQEVVRQELETRFNLTGVHLDTIHKQSRTIGYKYKIIAENGTYTAQFKPDEVAGFELKEISGESLRGRRNAFDAMTSLPDEIKPSDVDLEYEKPELYTLREEEGEWKIRLIQNVVTEIKDPEGIVRYRYQNQL